MFIFSAYSVAIFFFFRYKITKIVNVINSCEIPKNKMEMVIFVNIKNTLSLNFLINEQL